MSNIVESMTSLLTELESREATRARLRAIRKAVQDDEAAAKKPKPKRPERKLGPGEKMVFGRVVKVG